MQFRDLKQQYARIKPRLDEAALACFARADFISGGAVRELEQQLAAYTGRRHCIACANGTDALVLVLRAWGIGPGDAVFVPDFTFFASAECVSNVGATPIFVDVEEDTFNLSPAALERVLAAVKAKGDLKPKAIIGVDLFGLPADYEKIEAFAKQNGLLLLEDAAQGFGGRQGARRACAFGDAATTSFFPAKPLGCYGDGGAIFTDDDDVAALIRSLAVHGKGADKYDNVRIGYNSRLDTLQAVVLLEKLAIFEDECEAVNRVAAAYTEKLGAAVQTPHIPAGFYSSWAQYTLRLPNAEIRNTVAKHLADKGIPTMVYYPRGMRQMQAFADLKDIQPDACASSAKLTQTVLSLPMHPYLTQEEITQVADAVLEALV